MDKGDMEYDRKFEEMKKYIPFLESMIKRLENSNSDSNPRQAQLDKIRSLRDLLLDKKKRMKMENLLKCEQVLINLYAKVEQRDVFPRPVKDDSSKQEKADLNIVRSKLKSFVTKLKPDNVETLPEIARASEIEEVCLPGSKEPALFQRRPNLQSSASIRNSSNTNEEPTKPKNTYTGVLVSPTRNEIYWSNETSSEKPLFSRRSPKISPRKRSPHKKERKKSNKNKLKHNRSRDLNITLNVPEDSIDSLNTKDILSRIINCSDNDVDIASLRELRTQILGELKETGTSDDISDIILKSYKSKKIKQGTVSEKTEIEEGELSDSESEAIESIYGSLVVLDKNNAASTGKCSTDKEKQRKIQLRLVYSDKTKPMTSENKVTCVDKSDFETFNKQKDHKDNEVIVLDEITVKCDDNKDILEINDDLLYNEFILEQSKELKNEAPSPEKIDSCKESQKIITIDLVTSNSKNIRNDHENNKTSKNNEGCEPNSCKPLVDVVLEEKKSESINTKEAQQLKDIPQSNTIDSNILAGGEANQNPEVSIPLLEPTKPILVPSKEVSEIDILQALKNEILCETTNVLNTDDATASAVSTPLLHQPKITKVTNAKEIGPKKRISIENYKAKTCTSKFSIDSIRSSPKEDTTKKQSLKLTEKECERFNFLSKLTLTESSDDEDKSSLSLDDIYTDLAPKSPDHDDFADTGIKPPVIIPSDPIQELVVGSELDVDMRKLLPNIKPDLFTTPLLSPIAADMVKVNKVEKEINKDDERISSLADPRIKRDVNSVSNQDTLNLQSVNVEKMQSPLPNSVVHNKYVDQQSFSVNSINKSIEFNITSNIPPLLPNTVLNSAPSMRPTISMLMTPSRTPNVANMTPNRTPNIVNMTPSRTPNLVNMTPNRTPNIANMTPNRTPNIANMTPNRTPNIANMTPNMTPSHHSFDTEDSTPKHVYAPMFSSVGLEKSIDNNQIQWDTSESRQSFWEEKDPRNWSVQKDVDYRENRIDIDYKRSESMQRDIDYRDMRSSSVQRSQSFDQRDCERMQYQLMGNHFGKLDCPPIPIPPFDRSDCSPTPTSSFGRLDCPPNATPSFGRLDCPSTPAASFGRLDCPQTPTPSFGRLDCPSTPAASFGRLDCPQTPTPSFGRGDRPMTPVHSFNRSECPLTPTHYFGRTDKISPLLGPEPMGRSEYKSGSKVGWSQDPRLHRSSDYDSNQRRDDDRERNYFQERKFNVGVYKNDHQRDYKRYHHEQSVERNDRNKSYEPSHNYRDQLPRHETSVGRSYNREDRDYGRSYSREYENDRYSRNRNNRGRGYDYRNRRESKSYEDSNRRSYHHDRSGGNLHELKDHRDNSKNLEQNKLRVNPHGGSSFTIDTSINTSFQTINAKQTSNSSFDARRQRASSVGRTISSTNRTHDIKHSSIEPQEKITNTKRFRRACSVGREIKCSKLDFMDVKADLKSFKLKSDIRFSKDYTDEKPSPVPTKSTNHVDPPKEQKLYSPRKNSRDPRMYREHKDSRDIKESRDRKEPRDTKESRDNKECKSGIGDSKKHGIVYSDDNISKGTILGSGYGVKNYKIPKLRRPQVVTEISQTTTTSLTTSSTTNYDDEDNQITKDNDKNEMEKASITQEEEEDLNKVESFESKPAPSGKTNTKEIQDTKTNVTKENVDYDSQMNHKESNETSINILNESSEQIDKVERRVTRSSRKYLSEGSISLELSPIKRSRKSKKTLVVESDSDDNEMVIAASENSKKYPLKTVHTLVTENTASNPISSIKEINSNQNDEKAKQSLDIESNELLDLNEQRPDDLVSTVGGECIQESKIKSNVGLLENVNTKRDCKSNENIQEKVAEQTLDLDSSLDLVDLEMFPDNITSVPNINALIAELDHDLNSSKNTDANSHFTKELNLETMLENLSNPNKTDKKLSVSFDENDVSKIHEINTELNNGNGKSLICSNDNEKYNDVDDIAATIQKKSSIKFEQTNENDNPQLELESKGSEIQASKIGLETCVSENSNPCAQHKNSTVNAEDSCRNDAIVSTSDDDKNLIRPAPPLNLVDNDCAPAPDSTLNTNVENVYPNIILPSTHNSECEMNSDVSSTHTTEAVSKDTLEEVSSDVEKSSDIKSIGKLLSILQDKNKIKELLSLLDDQTSENEKIKKKLEMLSEIVSDDEIENTTEEILDDAKNSNKTQDPCNINTAPHTEIITSNVDSNDLPNNYQKQHKVDSIESQCDITSAQNENQGSIVITSVEDNCKITSESQEKINKTSVENNRETASVQNETQENIVKTIEESTSVTKTVKDVNIKTTTMNDVANDEVPSVTNDLTETLSQKNIEEESGRTNEPSNTEDVENNYQNVTIEGDKPTTKKRRRKRGKKWNSKNKQSSINDKRLTRADTISSQPMIFTDKSVKKRPSRELQRLQEDIREMFLKDDILNATGIRMCRIAKLTDDKSKDDNSSTNESNQEPSVFKKINDPNPSDNPDIDNIPKKKPTKNVKNKGVDANSSINKVSNVGRTPDLELQSKTKLKEDKRGCVDPYDFETDSVSKIINACDTKNDSCSESESDSVDSSKSAESTEVTDIKKKIKLKRGRLWQAGIIKPKNRKKKSELKPVPTTSTDDIPESQTCKLPDFTCFTDRTYCFRKQVVTYSCRICVYSGSDIVHHYKNEHPHTEVPLSRLSPPVAKQAIKESEDANFQEISKISSKKYICRFCFKEFSRKKRLLEAFFWHVVSMHTGEYKHTCSKCVDTQICPLDIDIPPPPNDANGQLLGYICEKCNYTQISLENLKTHVIVWHNDEQTAVYTINLASLTRSAVSYLLNHIEPGADSKQPRVLRSTRSNQSMADASDSDSDSTEENIEKPTNKPHNNENTPDAAIKPKTGKINSKITFENDITDEISNFDASETAKVKIESDISETQEESQSETENRQEKEADSLENTNMEKSEEPIVSQDIIDYPHFKIMYTESQSRLYVCCINGNDYHYKTSLLISMKKHIQLNHTEKWDGYCCICKVIVTPQGQHKFKDCFQHFLDNHIDSFPILEHVPVPQTNIPEINKPTVSDGVPEKVVQNKSYINVRRLSDLITNTNAPQPADDSAPVLPVIESVISLGAHADLPRPSPSYPTSITEPVETIQYKYEEFQADVMSRKHRVVLEAMMAPIKLVQVFKCAGRFCSFTTNNAEEALLHASTHLRVGGVDSLCCVYCDFDACGNAIDLITHVFKYHGCCPYVCSLCFYRAAANPLVNAHIKRVHNGATNGEILKAPFQTTPLPEDNILTREAAVPYYLCCDKSSPDAAQCKFRTYTPGKFCEHLQTRHSSATEFSCFICSISVDKSTELIRHFKTHGLKLYQCTWCVFGAVDENELLEHASALHPARQPKAYLRIITKKDGTTEHRVLPLAHLNKSDVPAVEVAASTQQNFPVREAERSIELEKLIGHTNSMIDTMSAGAETIVGVETNADATESTEIEINSQLKELLERDSILENAEMLIARMKTPPPAVEIDQSESSTPILKPVTIDTTPEKALALQPEPEIVCLDSDDESPPPNETSQLPAQGQSIRAPSPRKSPVQMETKKVSLTELFTCSRCSIVLKCGSGFRKHINACFANTSGLVRCAHCPKSLSKKNIVNHYNDKHSCRDKLVQHVCQKCSLVFNSPSQAKEHMLTHHNKAAENSTSSEFVKELKSGPKSRRKRHVQTSDKSDEPPEKVKRYGPQDIDKLPINPILDDSVVCSLCEFNTKVRLNMVRHLQMHAQQQPVPQTAPVNPVPHLETNEKHFDKMLNLASSSFGLRQAEKTNKPDSAPAALQVPPESVARYPKYVCDKQRLTCGARGCSYTSVDESMLKCHWETLHYGTNDFHCVHCPPYQQLDKTKPVTAARIIAHLKMHDEKLFACSSCSYYHHRLQIVEKHIADVHKGGRVMLVRDGKPAEVSAAIASTAGLPKPPPAPTMDLKPWQCGLCKFKSLLRPEVADHCAKVHNSKMQYKCAYCAFRTSNPENITKHQSKSHVGKAEEIFYYYYREGTVPDDTDGTPRWQKQSQSTVPSEPKVKSEDSSDIPPPSPQKLLPALIPMKTSVDLNLVKKEIEPIYESVEDLCREFGQFCEPNGLKYKCPLCNNVTEDRLEVMQSHLYEELKYRKWGCSICLYKAFHKEGLGDHMKTEHRQNRDPIELPTDKRIETWVAKLLEHQTSFIAGYKENLARQKEEILRTNPGPSTSKVPPQPSVSRSPPSLVSANKRDETELEKMFGSFGAPKELSFCCPKCSSTFKEEDIMHNHLESELNKIRWYCSNCSMKFQTYHEAQYHSKSVHMGQGARPVEATKNATVRAAWIEAAIKTQKQGMDIVAVPNTNSKYNEMDDMSQQPDNSLLVVRYEKRIPTPEEEMARRSPMSTGDSDDEKLTIDEPIENRLNKPAENCRHCKYTTISSRAMRLHLLRHYNLKQFTCSYCDVNGTRKGIEKHQKTHHPTKPINLVTTAIPDESPSDFIKKASTTLVDPVKVVCLVCRKYFTEADSLTHSHDDIFTTFGKKGEIVVQCNDCHSLHKDLGAYVRHHKYNHFNSSVNYLFCKLNTHDAESKELLYSCDNCTQKFSHLQDLKVHANAYHQSILKYTLVPKHQNSFVDELQESTKRKCADDSILPPSKRTARKSTTKLPSSSTARKSTTKLPYNVICETIQRSWYGQKPSTEGLESVVVMMPFCNKMMPFTLNKLKDIINIDPVVTVSKLNAPDCVHPVKLD
ncbi:uncharacterized protein LOC112056160 [Bicyclus anynana]|uniref:Uncharacterized protein LOC112056160 n=1 Tax=Bicyclus anynana TaxID=110368 RepID=A0A6J1NXH6_BICAN|nr:uncharacterized protein LOC112056160 [Bicyclus anynana]XP_023952294.1 uncharacterized protein LOC112056160 [Bicyclus anynana]XP_023952295.1 uncharacterized protein LOC112056160 [Bicyclus anynana]